MYRHSMLSGLCILACGMFSLNSISGRIFLLLEELVFSFIWKHSVSVIIKINLGAQLYVVQ